MVKTIMGDKSPKSARKQAQQKQTKTDTNKQRKEDIETAKRPDDSKKDISKGKSS
jgi:hypothetical protein